MSVSAEPGSHASYHGSGESRLRGNPTEATVGKCIMDIPEIIEACKRDETGRLTIPDMRRALEWVGHSLRHDIFYSDEQRPHEENERLFSSVTDVMASVLVEMSRRVRHECSLAGAYYYHDLVHSSRELWWSVPNDADDDEYYRVDDVLVRTAGRHPWTRVIDSAIGVLDSGLEIIPRTIPAFEQRVLYSEVCKKRMGLQSRTVTKCAVTKDDLPPEMTETFDRYALAQLDSRSRIQFVPVTDPSDIPSREDALRKVQDEIDRLGHEPFPCILEMTERAYEADIPMKVAVWELGLCDRPDIEISPGR